MSNPFLGMLAVLALIGAMTLLIVLDASRREGVSPFRREFWTGGES